MSETSLRSKVGDLALYRHVWVFSLSFFVLDFLGLFFSQRPVVNLDIDLFSVYEQSFCPCPLGWRVSQVVSGVRLAFCMFVNSVYSKQTKYLFPCHFFQAKGLLWNHLQRAFWRSPHRHSSLQTLL